MGTMEYYFEPLFLHNRSFPCDKQHEQRNIRYAYIESPMGVFDVYASWNTHYIHMATTTYSCFAD